MPWKEIRAYVVGRNLDEGVVKTEMEATTKEEAIEELVDLLVEAHEIPMSLRDHVLDVVMERERSMSTGMEKGIALPHGASSRVQEIVGALGIVPEGLPFDSLDGEPARLVVLLVLPKDRFQAHVRTLAGIAHLLGNPTFRQQLVSAADAERVLELIENAEDDATFDQYRADA